MCGESFDTHIILVRCSLIFFLRSSRIASVSVRLMLDSAEMQSLCVSGTNTMFSRKTMVVSGKWVVLQTEAALNGDHVVLSALRNSRRINRNFAKASSTINIQKNSSD